MVESYIKTHLFYIVLIIAGVIGFRLWLSEHDARVQAQSIVKQQEVTVVNLQKQIDAIQAVTAAKVQVVTKVVHDAQTPSQVVAAVPQLTNVPLAVRTIPGNPVDVVVAAQPLLQVVAEDKTAQIELAACQQTVTLQGEQLVAKGNEVAALKKKPKFFTRAAHVAEAVAAGLIVGLLVRK